MRVLWRGRVSRFTPRIIALAWAGFALWTLVLYIPPPPPQVAPLSLVSPVGLWVWWAIPAVLLMLGGLVPPRAPEKHRKVARMMRVTGLIMVAALLSLWASFYLGREGIYTPHLAKNYITLAVGALACMWFIGREVASVQAVHEEEVTADAGLDH